MRRCQNRPVIPADVQGSGKRFRSPRYVSSDKAKGREERGSWGFYRGSNLQRGLGFGGRIGSNGRGSLGLELGSSRGRRRA
jgi:hypothetical protein